MKRIISALALLAGIAGPACADNWTIGYSFVPLTFEYMIDDNAAAPVVAVDRQGEESYSLGTVNINYQLERKLLGPVNMVLTTGVALPAGSGEFDLTKCEVNNPVNTSRNATNAGDSVEYSMSYVPILIGAKAVIPVGKHQITGGLSIGEILASVSMKETDIAWAGTAPNQVQAASTVTYVNMYTNCFALLAEFGFTFNLGTLGGLTASVPIGMVFDKEVFGRTETTNSIVALPAIAKENNGMTLGGFTAGFRVGWNKSF